MLGIGSEIFSKQMFFLIEKGEWTWIHQDIQPLPLNGICDRFLEGININ